jgi:hypothetical protein
MVLFGSGLGSGGFRHPGHLAFDEQHSEPLATLFVTMLKRVGIEADLFSSRTGALRELDACGHPAGRSAGFAAAAIATQSRPPQALARRFHPAAVSRFRYILLGGK